MYWAEALANQEKDVELKEKFSTVFSQMKEGENKIVGELNDAQGVKVEIGGYYHPNEETLATIMRPSQALNSIIDNI